MKLRNMPLNTPATYHLKGWLPSPDLLAVVRRLLAAGLRAAFLRAGLRPLA